MAQVFAARLFEAETPPMPNQLRKTGRDETCLLVGLAPGDVNLTLRSILHGIAEPSTIPVGLAAPGICDCPFHPAPAGYVLVFHHPLSRPSGRTRIYLRRGNSRPWIAPPVL